MTITGKARLAGVMGWPVGHSRSPLLHGHWLAEHGIDGAYLPLAVRPERAADALRALVWLGFRGCNVTVPHKVVALATVDRADETARRIGAVNTVVVREDGTLEGRNTDAFGYIENLRAGAPAWRAGAGPAVVIGAGGAARAVVVALADAGVPEIRVTNRTAERADALAAALGARSWPWARRMDALADAALVVNTTTQGMTGQPPLELDPARLPDHAVVHDIVYVPRETPLIAAARARGLVAVEGLGMLLHQARPGFEAWFGVAPAVTPALEALIRADIDGAR